MAACRNGTVAAARRKPAKGPEPPADLQATAKATWDLLWRLPQVCWPGDELPVSRLCRVEDAHRAALSPAGQSVQKHGDFDRRRPSNPIQRSTCAGIARDEIARAKQRWHVRKRNRPSTARAGTQGDASGRGAQRPTPSGERLVAGPGE